MRLGRMQRCDVQPIASPMIRAGGSPTIVAAPPKFDTKACRCRTERLVWHATLRAVSSSAPLLAPPTITPELAAGAPGLCRIAASCCNAEKGVKANSVSARLLGSNPAPFDPGNLT